MDIVIANIINGVGVFLLIMAHAFLSLSNSKYNFIISALGCFLVIIGSVILESYPIVVLNFLWMVISIYAFFDKKILPKSINKKYLFLLYLSFLLGLISVLCHFLNIKIELINFESIAAYQTTFIYLFAYVLFVEKIIIKKEYLIWTTLGFFILFPHLMYNFQYSVLFNEVIGAIIGILGIIKIKKEA